MRRSSTTTVARKERRGRRAWPTSRHSSPSAISRRRTVRRCRQRVVAADVRRAVLRSPAAPAGLPSANLVFVQSRDGNTVTTDPSSLGGGEADKHLIYEGLSRVAADAVLAGARRLRGGRIVLSVWRPELVALRAAMGLPRHPIQIVATLQRADARRGRCSTCRSCASSSSPSPAARTRCATRSRQRRGSRIVVMDDRRDLRDAFGELRRPGNRAHVVHRRPHDSRAQLLDAGWFRTCI